MRIIDLLVGEGKIKRKTEQLAVGNSSKEVSVA